MTAEVLHLLPPPPALEDSLAIPGNEARDYRWYLIERGMSANTIRHYTRAVRVADAWCEERGYPLRTVPGPVIAVFAETLPKSWSSRRVLRTALKHYWALFERKNPPLWAIRVPRKQRMVCRALSVEEAAALAKRATERGDRAGLAVLIGLYQGFRRSEIATIAWDDLTEDGWIKVLGKGNLPAVLPLNPAVSAALAAYRATPQRPRGHSCSDCEHGRPNRWVFPARIGDGHVSPTTVWTWVVQVSAEVGIENMTTHRLRHTALATALDATGDLRAVADFARHASVETTQGYTRTTEERLRAVMASIEY